MAPSVDPSARPVRDDRKAAEVRLLTGNIGGRMAAAKPGNPNVFVKKLLTVCQSAAADGDAEALEAVAADLIHNELAAFELAAERLELEVLVAARDKEAYAQLRAELEAEIKAEAAAIESKKAQLADSRVFRAHQEEYDTVKKLLLELPRRSDTLARMERVKQQIANCGTDAQRLERVEQCQKKELTLLAHVLRQLQAGVKDDRLLGRPADDVGEEGQVAPMEA